MLTSLYFSIYGAKHLGDNGSINASLIYWLMVSNLVLDKVNRVYT